MRMRRLEFQDVFTLGRIIEKAKLKEDFVRAYKSGREENVSQEDIGINVIFAMLAGAVKEGVEQEIYDLLGSITGMDADAVRHQSIPDMLAQLKQIAKENDLISFFEYAKAAMK